MKNERLEAALNYVRRGWLVFPVPPGLKCGYSVDRHITDGPWGCTRDADIVRRYWNDLPRASIGLVMGIDSGIWDLEIDTKAGHPNLVKDGVESLAELEAKHGKLPLTLMFESPTGSKHHLFRHPSSPVPLHDEIAEANVRIRSGALDVNYPGIDVKGDGSMSVAPPSKTRKGTYRWINKRRIAAAPQWLLDMVIKPEYAPHEADPFTQFANSTKQVNIGDLTLATAMIPNTLRTSRDAWVRVGLALWSATGGSAEGYQLFRAWSRRWPNFNAQKTETFWNTIKKTPDEITAGTIYHLAEEAVPDWKSRICTRDPKVIKLLREFHKLLEE